MTDYREILRLQSLGFNNSQIAESMCVTRQTVITALQRATVLGLDWHTAEDMSDRDVAVKLLQSVVSKLSYKMPDFEYINREMSRPGVTLQLLWFEYCDKCRDSGEIAYQLTQFKQYYRDWSMKSNATMHINRKPGELLEVDWAGQTAAIVDTDTGTDIEAYIFVAALPYSGYSYVEAFLSRDQEAWTAGHVNAYNYFGGVTRILVPDNLKTGVTKHGKKEIILNRAYQEMAEHYGTAVIPTRIRKPKDYPQKFIILKNPGNHRNIRLTDRENLKII